MVSINWKKSIIPVALALTLLMSTIAFAGNNINSNENGKVFSCLRTSITERAQFAGECYGKRGELPEELKAKLDELKAKLENGEITSEQFREEVKQLMPEKFQFKARALPEELKAKHELKARLENGEITSEQFREKVKQLMPEKFQFKARALPEELKAKLDELKAKLENGEITSEQFREEMQQFKQEKL